MKKDVHMEKLVKIIKDNHLINTNQNDLNALKNQDELYFIDGDVKMYKNSFYKKDTILYFIAKIGYEKSLYLVSAVEFSSDFNESIDKVEDIYVQKVQMNADNSFILKKIFPFTAPVSLREKRTTIGCGDRLGRATPGHIRGIKQFDCYPVLAQQSIRELNFTKRTYNDVTADVAYLVFQEGFERGYGADGDHLKTIADIDRALKAGMPMITLDLSEVMNAGAAEWSEDKMNSAFEEFDQGVKDRIIETYGDKTFKAGNDSISLSAFEAKKCTVIYKKALDFAQEVDDHLRKNRGDEYDLEISIDETTTPTLPEHHLYIIKELIHRGVTVNSLAPRFIGEFQKAIDYIGNIEEFEKQFITHCEISKSHGHYKISVHSGSDKFSVYPAIGKNTHLRLHLKTAGTSWLEAVRCIALSDPLFYRKMHKKAFVHFAEASKFYHITADLSRIKDIDTVSDEDLPEYMNQDEARQLLHITYGGLLNDHELREDFFHKLTDYEDVYSDLLAKHFTKHISLLGVEKVTVK